MATHLQMPAERVRELLADAINAGQFLLSDGDDANVLTQAAQSWDKRNQTMLDQAFKVDGFLATSPKSDYANAMGLEHAFGLSVTDKLSEESIRRDVETKLGRLTTILNNMDLYYENSSSSDPQSAVAEQQLFIIHGRASAPRLEVEVLIGKATDIKPIVLSDQVNQGSTLIEKLEGHLGKSASFAVVLLTADDEGRLKGDGDLRSRARQNVILELGYAMAALGRRHVTLLYEPGVERPSDIDGIAYYELDGAGAWRSRILGELKTAGFEVDANALL